MIKTIGYLVLVITLGMSDVVFAGNSITGKITKVFAGAE